MFQKISLSYSNYYQKMLSYVMNYRAKYVPSLQILVVCQPELGLF